MQFSDNLAAERNQCFHAVVIRCLDYCNSMAHSNYAMAHQWAWPTG